MPSQLREHAKIFLSVITHTHISGQVVDAVMAFEYEFFYARLKD